MTTTCRSWYKINGFSSCSLRNILIKCISDEIVQYEAIYLQYFPFTIWVLTKERVERMRCLWVEFPVATLDDSSGPHTAVHWSHQTLMLFMFDSGADQVQGYTEDFQTKIQSVSRADWMMRFINYHWYPLIITINKMQAPRLVIP